MRRHPLRRLARLHGPSAPLLGLLPRSRPHGHPSLQRPTHVLKGFPPFPPHDPRGGPPWRLKIGERGAAAAPWCLPRSLIPPPLTTQARLGDLLPKGGEGGRQRGEHCQGRGEHMPHTGLLPWASIAGLLPTAAHCCPLLPTAAHCCPLLPTAAHCSPCLWGLALGS